MAKPTTLDKYRDYLWDDLDTIPDLTPIQRAQIIRYRAIFTQKLENPATPNTTVVAWLKEHHKLSDAQAYRDIAQTEMLLSKIRSSEKAWIRYLVVETLKEAINKARDNDDPDAMTKAAGTLAKYTRLDQEDQDPIPWEEIMPQPIEYVNDPTVLGLPAIENAKAYVERIKNKYIVDVDFEEVKG